MSGESLSTRAYLTVFAILLLSTYATWQIAYFDLGAMNTVAALGIAVFKAALVVLFFMHVKGGPRPLGTVVLASLFWLGILLVLTMSDYVTRAWKTYG